MSDDSKEEPHDGDSSTAAEETGEPARRDEDREAILARRALFLATAVAGLSIGCDSVTPQPCLSIVPMDRTAEPVGEGGRGTDPVTPVDAGEQPTDHADAGIVVDSADAGTTEPGEDAGPPPQPCLSVKPQACLKVAPPPSPSFHPCLTIKLPPPSDKELKAK